MAISQRARIAASLALVLGILVGSSALEYVTMRTFVATSREIRAARDTRSLAQAALSALNEGVANNRAWELTGNEAFYRSRQRNLEHFQASLTTLSASLLGRPLRSDVDAFQLMLNRHVAEHAVDARWQEPPRHAVALIAAARGVLTLVEQDAARRAMRGERFSELLSSRAATIAVVGTSFAISMTMLFALLFQYDVRKRLAAEAALRDSEAQFRSVVGVLADGVIHMDRSGHVVGCNRAATEILGLTAEQIMDLGNRDWSGRREDGSRCAKEDHPAFVAIRTGQAQRDVVWGMTRPDGQRRWLLISAEPVFDELGKLLSVVSSFTDITARRAAEAALREANEALEAARDDAEKASRAKSEFLANMSHELRTPLNSVIGFANVLRANKLGNLEPDQIRYLERVHDNGKHLLSLINDVLDLSKVEAGHLELHVEDVPLGPMIYQTLAQLEGVVRDKPVTLAADLRADLQPLRADRRKLQQVLLNLVSNAAKFTERGTVTVRVISGEGGRPVRLDVVDTGIGIAPERQQAVFDAFQQADTTTSRHYGGTGLGLTITKSLLQLMGYHITLASEPGKGSVFSVHFHAQTAGTDARQADILTRAA